MALTDQQKADILDGMLTSVETDLYRAQLQLTAYQAEASATTDENAKASAQANVNNQQNNLAAMQARYDAWQAERSKLKV